jgi:DNA repair protein RecO (recombination protein O)
MAAAATSMRGARRHAHAGQSAFVLHGYDWSETSLILDLFTRDSGRVAVAAKGAKRPYSQLRSVLMPFQRIVVQFGRTRGDEAVDVHNLRGAEWAGQGIQLDGGDWFAGFYLNELLMRLLARDDPHPRLFDAYALTLRAMGRAGSARIEAALRGFELLLLRETGVLPELDRGTLTQQPVVADKAYALRPEQGLVEAGLDAGALPGSSWLALEAALQGLQAHPDAEQIERLHAATAAAGAALRPQLRRQLHYHLSGAPLRTRQVMVDAVRLLGLDNNTAAR